MEEHRYLIFEVRSTGLAEEAFQFEAAGSGDVVEAVMSAESLSERDAADARRDPRKVVAEPVPMELIRPVAEDDADGSPEAGPVWGIEAVGALDSPLTGSGVKVAVLDTGIDAGHPAFAGLQVTQRDFTGEGDGDEQGHGTHCAGTIAGREVDGVRFGVAPGVSELLVGKVLGRTGGGTSEGIVEGMLWALRSGANVISMSLGMDFPGLVEKLTRRGLPIQPATSRALEDYRDNLKLFGAIAAFLRMGGAGDGPAPILVAATGNESERALQEPYTIGVAPPAASEGFIPVGAVSKAADGFAVAPFSNTGAAVAAPGVDIVSARPGGGFATKSGTSMATPHAAGVAALWGESIINATGALDPGLLSARLQGNSKQLAGLAAGDGGAGLVQAPRA